MPHPGSTHSETSLTQAAVGKAGTARPSHFDPAHSTAKAAGSSWRWFHTVACLTAAGAIAPVMGTPAAWADEAAVALPLSEETATPATAAASLGEAVSNVAPPEAIHLAPEGALELAQTPEPSPDEKFGAAGSDRWYIQGAAATTFDNEFALAGAGISHFFANGHSVNLELNGMAFVQDGEDAVGANLNLLLRHHLVRRDNWSLYIDGGAGILGTTDNVPSGGSSFNFTPQAGGGATIRLNDRERLMVGLRWHHISNADTFDSNPGRDSLMGYVGLNLPR